MNGAIHVPAGDGDARPEAVAVQDGRIAAVGTDADLRELAGAGTEIVDLRGGMLIPGFQDAHVHPPASGVEMLHCNLADAFSIEEYERLTADEYDDRPWTREELETLAWQAGKRIDWEDMDEYDRLPEKS